MSSFKKYHTPEWKKTPVQAQIREALKEIEQVRAAWKALEKIAVHIEIKYQAALEAKHRWAEGRRGDNVAKIAAEFSFTRSTELSMGGLRIAEDQLKQLKQAMLDLCESEMGLFALMTPGFTAANWFLVERKSYLEREAAKFEQFKMAAAIKGFALPK